MAKSTKPQELAAAVEALQDEPLAELPASTPLVFVDEAGATGLDAARTAYTVTKTAPPRVAGRRVKPGDTIHLTEAEARGELLALHITPPAAGLSAEQVAAISEIL